MTRPLTRKERIAKAFGAAAQTYPDNAAVQRLAAMRLAARIAALPLPARPKVLEIGCGSGFLTAALAHALPDADLTVTDLSPDMLDACRTATGVRATWQVMDGEHPTLSPGTFDLVCAGLTVQWFDDLDAGLTRLCGLLKPGGHLAFSTLLCGTFGEWRDAHADQGLTTGALDFAAPERLRRFSHDGVRVQLVQERFVERHESGAAFVRTLKAIGAQTSDRPPLKVAPFKRVLRRFEDAGAVATYELGYGTLRRRDLSKGVFVTGTDTDVGKTVVSAVLVRALGADYWKPVQTGTAVDPGDTAAVARLAGLTSERIHPPAYEFAEPLSPHTAAALENAKVELSALALPLSDRPLIVEGAGGALVPLNGEALTIELMQRLGLPVVVVARSTLGTINHTLLTLEALRLRGLDVLGVVMSGPPNAANRLAIETYGDVRVLAEIPHTDDLTPEWVQEQARALEIPRD